MIANYIFNWSNEKWLGVIYIDFFIAIRLMGNLVLLVSDFILFQNWNEVIRMELYLRVEETEA